MLPITVAKGPETSPGDRSVDNTQLGPVDSATTTFFALGLQGTTVGGPENNAGEQTEDIPVTSSDTQNPKPSFYDQGIMEQPPMAHSGSVVDGYTRRHTRLLSPTRALVIGGVCAGLFAGAIGYSAGTSGSSTEAAYVTQDNDLNSGSDHEVPMPSQSPGLSIEGGFQGLTGLDREPDEITPDGIEDTPLPELVAYENPGMIEIGDENGCVTSIASVNPMATEDRLIKTTLDDSGYWTDIPPIIFDQIACVIDGFDVVAIQPVRNQDGGVTQVVNVEPRSEILSGSIFNDATLTPEVYNQAEMLVQSGITEPCILSKTTTGCDEGPKLSLVEENRITTTAKIIAAQAVVECADNATDRFLRSVRKTTKQALKPQGDDAISVTVASDEDFDFTNNIVASLVAAGGYSDQRRQSRMFDGFSPEVTCKEEKGK